jgi:hypothetical protein
MYHYADTLGFDLAVVMFVVGVMPLAVFLMQSKRKLARATALALMFAAVLYVAVFEHYRLHRPQVTELGLKRAIVPEAVLDFLEAQLEDRRRARREEEFLKNQLVFAEIATLQLAADDEIARTACASFGERGVADGNARLKAPRSSLSLGNDREAILAKPLAVHLSHGGAGDQIFVNALGALERKRSSACATDDPPRGDGGGRASGEARGTEKDEDEKNDEEDRFAAEDENDAMKMRDARAPTPAPALHGVETARANGERGKPSRCESSWRTVRTTDAATFSGALDPSNAFVTFEVAPSRMDRSLAKMRRAMAGKPYRGVFVVRDPRDVVTEAYLTRVKGEASLGIGSESRGNTQKFSRSSRDVLDSSESASELLAPRRRTSSGLDFEIEAFGAAASSANIPLSSYGPLVSKFHEDFIPDLKETIHRILDESTARVPSSGATEFEPDSEKPERNEKQTENAANVFASSLRAFATRNDPNVRFVRYEDLLVATPLGFERLARWFGMCDEEDIQAFAEACADAQTAAAAAEEPPGRSNLAVPPGTWRQHFTRENAEKFEKTHGALLRSLGYPSSARAFEGVR